MALDLTTPPAADVQAARPGVALALPRVGVTGVQRTIRTAPDVLISARLDVFVDLPAGQRGAHMSRFEQAIDEVVQELTCGTEPQAALPVLARRLAERVRDRQGALRAEVCITARAPRQRAAPVSAAASHDPFTLLATAVATAGGTRCLLGVTVQGLTACPCAQEVVAGAARERLAADGFTEDEVQRILEHVPVATHNQRGIGTLHIGLPPGDEEAVDPLLLVGIVESSMSSEIYELMKRPDEAAVVEKAHRRPRFVEDCVREMLGSVVERLDGLPAATFVSARQENLESIHQHNVVAEHAGLLADLRAELETGVRPARQPSARDWLGADADPETDGATDAADADADAGTALSVRRSPKK
jgi:GTP cyclohydrolase-4